MFYLCEEDADLKSHTHCSNHRPRACREDRPCAPLEAEGSRFLDSANSAHAVSGAERTDSYKLTPSSSNPCSARSMRQKLSPTWFPACSTRHQTRGVPVAAIVHESVLPDQPTRRVKEIRCARHGCDAAMLTWTFTISRGIAGFSLSLAVGYY